MEKEVVIKDDSGNDIKVKIRRITYGEYNEILKSCMKLELIGGMNKGTIDLIKFRHDIVRASADKSVDVDKLPVEEALKLENEVMEFNGLSGEASFQ